MNIAVFGASGFVGNYILDELDNNKSTFLIFPDNSNDIFFASFIPLLLRGLSKSDKL